MSTEFRHYLQSEWARRAKANPRFSLRAYARYLKIEPALLSKLLRGERAITDAMLKRLGTRLGLSAPELARFEHSLDSFRAKRRREMNREKTPPLAQPIPLQDFSLLEEWYHLALLELAETRSFRAEAPWIAARLSISIAEATQALTLLQQKGFLIEINGRLRSVPSTTTTHRPGTSQELRAFQTKILEQAITALDLTPPDLRSQSAVTLAIDSALIPELKDRIQNFRREIMSWVDERGRDSKDSVYQMSLSLFPVAPPVSDR